MTYADSMDAGHCRVVCWEFLDAIIEYLTFPGFNDGESSYFTFIKYSTVSQTCQRFTCMALFRHKAAVT